MIHVIEKIDIIVPIYNEAAILEKFHQQLSEAVNALPCDARFLYVNDGSTDGTDEALRKIAESDGRVIVIELSRNFGHQAALSAGLDLANGDAVITMDGDGQHPPELIPAMLQLFSAGYDIVLTQRASAQEISFWKRWSSTGFYRLLNWISETKLFPGSADFRLMSRQVVASLRQMQEYHRLLRGMIAWMGYRTVILPYRDRARLGGKTKYSVKKMIRLAISGVFSFSLVPLQIGIVFGLCFLIFAFLQVTYVLSFWLEGRQHMLVPGWSSLMFVVLIIGGILMLMIGIMGMYVGYIFQEIKRRPIYLIKAIYPTFAHQDKSEGNSR